MRKITADYIFPASVPPIEQGVIVVDKEGCILAIEDRAHFPQEELEVYEGIICPGFINTHCHLELSYLKGMVPNRTGLVSFIKDMQNVREAFSEEEKKAAIEHAEQEMIRSGIVAVGDISNDTTSFEQKSKGNLRYHTFVEVFDLWQPGRTEAAIKKGKDVLMHVPLVHGDTRSMSFHAPYTCSGELIKMADAFTAGNGRLMSVHVQETAEENDLFYTKSGNLLDLFSYFNLDISHIDNSGRSSLVTALQELEKNNKILLVHNTFSNEEDIRWALKNANAYWCFCPGANLYIEDALPDFSLFLEQGCIITVGTDSYASNWQLSVLEELKIIEQTLPDIELHKLIQWGTLNGAEFLNFTDTLGSIEKGKAPGLNLIKEVDLKNLKLTPRAKVVKLV